MAVQIQKTTDHGYLNATDISATQALYPSAREHHRSGSNKKWEICKSQRARTSAVR